ncbi:MAG TPA: TIGR01777 family oxidoreductase [Nitrospinota bacterium]|nr:TIGR01777 family oxidoreductase [Nitrospinota bacterium]
MYKRSILITGATGFIGKELCRVLKEKGHEIIILTRNPEKAKERLSGITEIKKWSALKELPPVQTIEKAQAVIHLAGENISGRWNEDKKRLIRESRILSTQNIVKAMEEARTRPELFISASAIGYYGDRGDEILTEDSTPGKGFLTDICKDWEEEAKKAEKLGLRVVRLRIGIVLGPNGGALKEMLFPFKLGLGGALGNGKQWMAWIHREDLIGIILHILQNKDIKGAVNGTAPEPVQNKVFSKTLGHVLHRPVVFNIPAFALKMLFGEFAEFLLYSERVLPKRIEDFNYQFRYRTLEPALKECLLK